MDQYTFKIEAEEIEEVDKEAAEKGLSRSHYVRQIVKSRHDDQALRDQVERLQETVKDMEETHEERISNIRDEYEREIDHLEAQIERLQRTNLKILEERDRNTELEVYVDEQREWREANWLTRQKWKLLGKSTS